MIRRVLAAVLAVVALLVALAAGLLLSSAGTRLVVEWAVENYAPALELDGLQGTALRRLCVDRLSYRAPAVTVRARNVCIRPNLWTSVDFLMVSAKSLDAELLEIITATETTTSDTDSGLALPLAVAVDRLRIRRLVVDGVEIVDLQSMLDLSNKRLRSTSNFVYQDHPARLKTSGSWKALRAQATYYGVNADVTVNLEGERLPFSLRAETEPFALDPLIGRDIVLQGVTLAGDGDLDGYRFTAEGHVHDPDAGGFARLVGLGDWAGIDLERLEIRDATVTDAPVQVARLDATASVRWRDEEFVRLADVVASATVDGQSVEATLDDVLITWRDDALVQLRRLEAGGTVFGRSLTASAPRVSIDALGVDFEPVVVLTEQADATQRLEVSGHVGYDATMRLAVRGSSLPLDLLDERLAGVVDASIDVTGAVTRPLIDGRYEMRGVRYRDQMVDSVTGTVAGPFDAAEVDVALQSEVGALAARFGYRWQPERLELVVRAANLNLAHTSVGAVNALLVDPVTIGIAEGGVRSSRGCLQLSVDREDVDTASICASVSYPDGPVTIELDPWQLPAPDELAEWVSFSGTAQGEVRLQTLTPPRGRMALALKDLVAHHDDVEPLRLGTLALEANMADGRADAMLETLDPQALKLRGELTSVVRTPLDESPIGGNLTLELDGIWAAETLLPMDLAYELGDVRGTIALRANAGGTIGAPQLTGELTLSDAGWRVLALNTAFEEFGLQATMTASEHLAFEGAGRVGGGGLAFSGELNDIASPQANLVAEIGIEDAGVVDLPDYAATVNGRLALNMTPSALRLDGDLSVPRAFVRIAELPTTAVRASPDQVLVGEESAAPTQQIRTSDIRFVLGDDVVLQAFGLSGNLVGNLRVRETPGKLREVTGVISIRGGTFEIYRRTLQIERGTLTFTGPEDDPNVNVIASRVVPYQDQDYRITLEITGTAKNLHTVVRSAPALSEEDALALLVTGTTLAQATAGQQSNVNAAAIGLGLLGATGITRDVASTIGVEEIILEQDEQGNMEYGAALRVNQNLYLRYTYGAFSRIGGVLLRYRLSRRVSVQAKTGDAHSIEIRYGVDD